MRVIIANSANYFNELIVEDLKKEYDVTIITDKHDLNYGVLQKINPSYVFFMHWSYIIPKEIYSNYECVIFHMTDLPFGRGGSPLQNLIARGITQTKISALRCIKELDAGDIYLKKELSLIGTAQEIYLQANKIIVSMIQEILKTQIKPCPQQGDVTLFQRRKAKDGDLSSLGDLKAVFDYIRMLDADGYPRAYVETEKLIFEFDRASLKEGEVLADVRIRVK